MKVIVACVILATAVLAADVKAPYPPPAYGKPAYDYGPPMPFAFGYAVKDDYYGINDYAHDTTSDGKTRTGVYRTLLPDGRVQVVTYKADDYGYLADVKYTGEAKYADYKPAYKPAAAYPKPPYPPANYPKPPYPAA